ncbi:hypothetical protein G5I_10808 [Acromyrmex echinatior]|uniref:Uncharacterized protein n=1 Tax=Acromyrmex echinatior TaxID=103372 RepID=F4WY09_ACREC|nr:hypothetical protein G5I_10808 [Acromyrmex echinatior]
MITRVDPKAKREPPLVDVRLKAATGRYRNVPRLGLKANQGESQRTLILGESSRFRLLISIKLRTYGNAESIDAVLVVNPGCHFASRPIDNLGQLRMLISHEIALFHTIITLMTGIPAHERSNHSVTTNEEITIVMLKRLELFIVHRRNHLQKKNSFYAAAADKKSPNFVSYLSLTWLCLKKNSPFLKGSRPRVSKRDSTIPLRAVSYDCCGNIKLRESPRSTLQSSELPQVTWDEPTINRKSSVYTG